MVDKGTPAALDKIVAVALRLWDAITPRIIALSLVSAFVVAMIADVAYPTVATPFYEGIVSKLAADAKEHAPDKRSIMQAVQQYNLSWYYMTNEANTISALTQPYAPALKENGNMSRVVETNGKRHFEAVANVDRRNRLHIGFCISPVLYAQLINPFGMLQSCPIILMMCVFFATLAAVAVVIHFSVVQPLRELERACGSIADGKSSAADALGTVDLSSATSEVKNLTARLQYMGAKPSSVSGGAAASAPNADGDQPEDVRISRSKIGEFYSKDGEEEFISSLSRELESLKSTHQLCQRTLDKLSDRFPTSIIYGSFFRIDSEKRVFPEAFLGLDDRTVQHLKRIDHSRILQETTESGGALMLKKDSLKEFGLQGVLSGSDIKTAIFLNVAYQGTVMGMLGIYFNTQGDTVDDRMRFLGTAIGAISRALYEVGIYEQELQAALTDPLTGVRNKKFFQDLTPKVFERAAANPKERPISYLMIHLDQSKVIADTQGQEYGDQALQGLASAIRQCVRTSDGDGKSSAGDFLIRFASEEFLIVMENTNATRACGIAERIRAAVEAKVDWPGKIGKCTVSCGVATYPEDGKTAQDLLTRSQTAAYYVKDEMGCNQVCQISQVPATYKAASESAVIGGELGVFDPCALLQSLSTAQKTGILEVHSPDGKKLWMVYTNGKPVQAKLGRYAGNEAIVEFITTFEEGSFSFQEKALSVKSTMSNIPVLDTKYNVASSLERCLMSGAVAQDCYKAAKAIVPSTAIVMRPIAPVEFSARWQALSSLPEPPSTQDFNIMSEIVQRSDGKTTLAEIFQDIEGVQTHNLMRGASLLVQHGLVNKKPAVPV